MQEDQLRKMLGLLGAEKLRIEVSEIRHFEPLTKAEMLKPRLSAEFIDRNAIDIINALQEHNFTTYLVGGCVRDLLLGIQPKDFDIVTMAPPEKVQRLVRPSYIIGRRFRLVLVKRHGQQFEVSTFRSANYLNEDSDEIDENIYGEPKEDALRRDFTINGLFYDPIKQEIIDYTDGLRDIEAKVVRMIGDPALRIEQDPIRSLRALRFSHKTDFSLDSDLRRTIKDKSHLLAQAVLPRVREEILKILRLDHPATVLWEAYDLDLLKNMLPELHDLMTDDDMGSSFCHLLNQGMEAITDPLDSYQLYTILLYSYLASRDPEWHTNLSTNFDERTDKFIRQQLGMHRVETEIFAQAVQLLKQLIKQPSPQGLKARHRDHVAGNRALYLALILADAYHYLYHSEIDEWAELLRTAKPNPPPEGQKDYRRRPKNRI